MKATAKLRYLRMAPRKVRMAADLIRGKRVPEAQRLLQFAAKHSALPVLKTLNSAVASARNNFQADEGNLYVSHIAVNEGPKLKRYRPRARGMAYEIQKKTSHVTVVVNEIEEAKTKKKTPKKKSETPAVPRESAKKDAPLPEKPKFKPVQEVAKPAKQPGIAQRIFRRKSI